MYNKSLSDRQAFVILVLSIMKKLSFAILALIVFACAPAVDKNQQAIESRVNAYMKNPENMLDVSNYKPLSFSAIDTLSQNGSKAYSLTLLYQGLNSASREVRREADVFFNTNFEVTEVITTKYLDAMSKEEYKKLGKE